MSDPKTFVLARFPHAACVQEERSFRIYSLPSASMGPLSWWQDSEAQAWVDAANWIAETSRGEHPIPDQPATAPPTTWQCVSCGASYNEAFVLGRGWQHCFNDGHAVTCIACEKGDVKPVVNTPITDQPPPTPSAGDMWQLVMADMEQLRKLGIERYGMSQQPNNGRDALVDAYQEALGLCVSLRQAIEERGTRA